MAEGMLPPLVAELKAKAGEFGAELKAARKEAKEAFGEIEGGGSKLVGSLKASMSGLKTVGKAAFLGIAGSAAAIGAEGVKSAMEYQESTSQIAANAGISQKAADAVGDAFLKTMGKSTFSAQQIAAAFGPVSGQLKATEGHALSASESMQVMQAAMDDAEATGADLGTTTASLASVMQTYHLNASQAAQASDVLFNASKTLNLPIGQVGDAMNKLHGRLGQLAPSMTDTGALLEELGTHGITGTRGVGVATTALSTLLGGSKNVQGELSKLGVHIQDANGNFVGMGSVIAQLQPKLAGMGTAQQTAALATLFGTSSAQVMQQVIAGGIDTYKKAADSVGEIGASQEAAEKKAKTWQGELKEGKAAISDLVVVVGERLIPVLSDMVSWVTRSIQWLSQHKDIAIALGVGVASILVPAILLWVGGLVAAAAAELAAMAPIILITAAVAALGIGIFELVTHWKQVWSDVKKWVKDGADFVMHIFDDVKNFITGHVNLIAAALAILLGPIGLIMAAALELGTHWRQVWDGIKTAITDAKNWIGSTIDTVVGFFTALPGRITSAVAHLWDGIVSGFKAAINFVIKAWDSIPTFHIHVPHIPGTPIGGDINVGLPHIPLLADGGTVFRAGLAVVGEAGPELLNLGAGASVHPLPGGAGSSRALSSTVLNYQPSIVLSNSGGGSALSESDVRRLLEDDKARLFDRLRALGVAS